MKKVLALLLAALCVMSLSVNAFAAEEPTLFTGADDDGVQVSNLLMPGKEYRFPGVDAFLKELNPVEGYLRVAPIPGMFDDASYNDLPPQPNAKKEN